MTCDTESTPDEREITTRSRNWFFFSSQNDGSTEDSLSDKDFFHNAHLGVQALSHSPPSTPRLPTSSNARSPCSTSPVTAAHIWNPDSTPSLDYRVASMRSIKATAQKSSDQPSQSRPVAAGTTQPQAQQYDLWDLHIKFSTSAGAAQHSSPSTCK